jgi:hypothetical protein
MAKTISGEDEALFIESDGEDVGLQAVRVNMKHSSKPLNRRYIKSMRGILLDYVVAWRACLQGCKFYQPPQSYTLNCLLKCLIIAPSKFMNCTRHAGKTNILLIY